MRKRSAADTKKVNVPQVGCFFVLGGKLFVSGLPWTEVPSLAGFRTCALGHPEYWQRLQEGGAVPDDMPYEECPRGRVNYEDARRGFTLFADRCIIRNKRLVGSIMNELNLPGDTSVLTDDHYRCPRCMGTKPTRKQEEDDWDF